MYCWHCRIGLLLGYLGLLLSYFFSPIRSTPPWNSNKLNFSVSFTVSRIFYSQILNRWIEIEKPNWNNPNFNMLNKPQFSFCTGSRKCKPFPQGSDYIHQSTASTCHDVKPKLQLFAPPDYWSKSPNVSEQTVVSPDPRFVRLHGLLLDW